MEGLLMLHTLKKEGAKLVLSSCDTGFVLSMKMDFQISIACH